MLHCNTVHYWRSNSTLGPVACMIASHLSNSLFRKTPASLSGGLLLVWLVWSKVGANLIMPRRQCKQRLVAHTICTSLDAIAASTPIATRPEIFMKTSPIDWFHSFNHFLVSLHTNIIRLVDVWPSSTGICYSVCKKIPWSTHMYMYGVVQMYMCSLMKMFFF